MDHPLGSVDGAGGGNQRLASDLAAKDALAIFVRRASAKQVDFDRLEVKELDEVIEGILHPSMLAREQRNRTR